jgi:hypothetical protein
MRRAKQKWWGIIVTRAIGTLRPTALSLFICRPGNVFVRETRFSRDKHLGTEGVDLIYRIMQPGTKQQVATEQIRISSESTA